MKRKMILITLILTLMAAPFQAASAQGPIPPIPSAYEGLVRRYGLRVTDTIPAGITPLEFGSPQQLEAFLSELSRQTQRTTHITYFERGPLPNAQVSSTSVSDGVVTRSCSVNVGMAKFKTWADIRVGSSGSFRWMDRVLNT